MSPLAEEMAKAEPSTRVTVVPAVPTATDSPVNVQGSDTIGRLVVRAPGTGPAESSLS
jgi:hypothetical protein